VILSLILLKIRNGVYAANGTFTIAFAEKMPVSGQPGGPSDRPKGRQAMNDPNVTADLAAAPADSRGAAAALGTIDYMSGSDSTGGGRRGAEASARGLPTVPGYRVLREIARGGMGKALAAFDLGLDHEVALKILLPGAEADRFVRESKITARLPHPGIPPVHALGTLADGSPFLAMKLIAGKTLAEQLKSSSGSEGRPQLLQAFTQVCQAVGFAHSRGIIHRDLKPGNVMVGAFGEVQVMDWGLAKDLARREADQPQAHSPRTPLSGEEGQGATAETVDPSPPGESTDARTQAGAILGTPAYMAPEQARGEAIDARADVFALGAILSVILTGQPPFRGDTVLEVIHRAAAADLAEANARLDGCGADADLVALCRRCLSPNPADRPANGQEVADGLTAHLTGVEERMQAVERERAVAVAREAEQRKRRRVWQLALTAVALVLAAGAAVSAYFAVEANSQADAAKSEATRANDKEILASANAVLAKKEAERMHQLLKDTHKDYGQTLANRLVTALWAKHAFPLKTISHKDNVKVTSVAFSPDGKLIVTGSDDRMARVWDVDTGTEKLALKPASTEKNREQGLSSVAFSPDAKRVVAGSWDRTARVWDAETGTEKFALDGHTDRVHSVAFSPDGKRIVTGAGDGGNLDKLGEVKVWDVQTGVEKLDLQGHTSQVTSVAFSPDGKLIVTGSWDNTARVWDAETVLTLNGHTDSVSSVALSLDGKRIVTGSHDRTARAWDAETGTETLPHLKGHNGPVTAVAFSPDGKRIATATGVYLQPGEAKLWDAETGTLKLALKGLSGAVRSLAFSPDGKHIAAGGGPPNPPNGEVKVWDVDTGTEKLPRIGHSEVVTSVAFSRDGKQIVTGSLDNTVRVWDAQTGAIKRVLTPSPSSPRKGGKSVGPSFAYAVAFSPDAKRIIAG
jgi:WD40 repeat protein/serine/threonine protein kinase